jgi:hypothetical protein
MRIAQQSSFKTEKSEVKSRDMTILLGYAAFAVAILLVVCLDSTPPVHSDFASMTVFP